MERYLWVLLALIVAMMAYELIAVFTNIYPTITETVATFPEAVVLLLALGFGVLAVHLVRAYDRRRRRRGE